MAASKRVYWLGEMIGKRRVGGIKVDGKHVAIGESFAADKLDKDRLSVFRKAGCISDAPFLIVEPIGDDLALLKNKLSELEESSEAEKTLLQGRISTMEADKKTDGDTIAGLQLELEADGDVTGLKKQIVELESEVERLTGDAKEAADLKAAHVAAHAEKKTKKKEKKK